MCQHGGAHGLSPLLHLHEFDALRRLHPFLLAFFMRQHVLWHFSTGCMHAHHLAIASHDMTPHKPDHRCISSMSAILAFV